MDRDAPIAGPRCAGDRISVTGRILDAAGAPVRDAMIEVWQANAEGIFAHPDDPRLNELEPDFRGWGRMACDFQTGEWGLQTVCPGAAPGGGAPHLSLWIVARGINTGLATRVYFPENTAANAADPVLDMVEPHRRPTLIAARDGAAGAGAYRFDIRLRGPGETVFLDL